MNPSSLAPTAPARLLCEPDLSSAGVTDGFPIREDLFEVYMRVLPPKQKLDTSFGESGQSCFRLVWRQRVGVTCPCTDTQERHSSRWVRGTRGEASCLLKVLKAAEGAEGFVLTSRWFPRIPHAQTQGWQAHLKLPGECSRSDTPYCHAVGYQAMSRRPPCPSGDEPLSWNRLVTSTKTKQKKPTSRWQDQNKPKEMILYPDNSLAWTAVCHRMLQTLKIYLVSKITTQIHGKKIWRLLKTRTPLTQGVWVTKKC